MKIKYIIILFVFLMSCNQTNTTNESKNQLVSLLIDEEHLGEIPNNELIELEIQFQNPSSKNINIENFQSSCGCTDIKMTSKEIKAGSTATVSIEYDPKDDVKETEKKIMFRLSNDQLLTYTFVAYVIKDN